MQADTTKEIQTEKYIKVFVIKDNIHCHILNILIGFLQDSQKSLHQYHAFCIGEIIGRDPVEVDATGHAPPKTIHSVPCDGVVARLFGIIHQCPHLLSEDVVDL